MSLCLQQVRELSLSCCELRPACLSCITPLSEAACQHSNPFAALIEEGGSYVPTHRY